MSRVLVVDARLPAAGASAAERAVVDLLQALGQAGHRVAFMALEHFADDDARREGLAGIDVPAGGGLGRIRGLLGAHDWDIVIVNNPGPGLVMLPLLEGRDAASVLYGHDLQTRRLAAQQSVTGDVAARVAALVAIAERRCWAGYPLAVYPTVWEAEFVNSVPGATAIATPYFRLTEADLQRAAQGPRRGLLMVGSGAYAPNLDAAQYAVRELLPLIDEDLTVVGDWPRSARERLGGARVRFTGRIPEPELRALHHSHTALLAPLRFGAGARRKIVAAMGLGLPVITTSEGVRGLLIADATADDGLLIADTPDDVVAALRQLRDPGFVTSLTGIAHARARKVYGRATYDAAVAAMLDATGA